MRRTLRLAPALALAPIALWATPTAAQQAPRTVEASFGAGVSLPTRDLGVATVTSVGVPVQFSSKLGRSPLFVGALSVSLPGDRASARVGVTYAQPDVSAAPSLCDGRNFDCSDFDRGEATSSVFTVSGTLLLRTSDPTHLLRPFFLAGLALRGYTFDDSSCSAEPVTCDALGEFLSNQFRPAVQVGLGTYVGRGSVRGTVEVSGFIGSFSPSGARSRGETQNDIFVSAGLVVPLKTR